MESKKCLKIQHIKIPLTYWYPILFYMWIDIAIKIHNQVVQN